MCCLYDMKVIIYILCFGFLIPLKVVAVSFTADAVQIRSGEFNHARVYWTDQKVRFDYLDQGVTIAQIYDTQNKKVIWLDTENKVFIKRELSDQQAKQKVVNKSTVITDPCRSFSEAQCVRLKAVKINDRDAIKWLITFDDAGEDQHVFQWIDKKYGVVIRQLNPDGSHMNATIEEGIEVNGRKARKIDMYAVSGVGAPIHGVRWYDDDLDVVIRQVFIDGEMDE